MSLETKRYEAPAEREAEPVSIVVKTAPERITLQVSDEPEDFDKPFPKPIGEEVTWSIGACVAVEVEYVRADLANISPASPCPRCDGYIEEIKQLQRKVFDLNEVKFKRFNNEDCWIYQGNGEDNLESLACPVVISAEKLAALEAENARLVALADSKRDSWEKQAVAWLRGKASEQAQTNERYPDHAKCYPSWKDRVTLCQRLADDLEYEVAIAAHKDGK